MARRRKKIKVPIEQWERPSPNMLQAVQRMGIVRQWVCEACDAPRIFGECPDEPTCPDFAVGLMELIEEELDGS